MTSDATWQGIRGLARGVATPRDSTGMPLVIAETRADRLGDISRYVHENERRCGGYFAFPDRAQAEAFVRGDRAKQAMAKSALARYALDNQATVGRWLPQFPAYATLNPAVASAAFPASAVNPVSVPAYTAAQRAQVRELRAAGTQVAEAVCRHLHPGERIVDVGVEARRDEQHHHAGRW